MNLKVRIVTTEIVQVEPMECDKTETLIYSQNSYSKLKRVPVLRIFGVTDRGQKICVHVHQIYPYIYIPYDREFQLIDDFCARLAISINHALSIALNRDPKKSQFVMAILPVRALDFYGFHSDMRCFLKIYLLDSSIVSRLSDLLLAGAIMGSSFQPYESHIPMTLQFLINHNLYGMDFMEIDDYRLRLPVLERTKSGLKQSDFPRSKKWKISENVLRMSTCELEIDTWPWAVKNRHLIDERRGAPNSPLLDRQEKLVHSLKEMWKKYADDTISTSQCSSLHDFQPSNNSFLQRVNEAITKIRDNNYNYLDKSNLSTLSEYSTAFEAISALYPNETNNVSSSQRLSLPPSQISLDKMEALFDAKIISQTQELFKEDLDNESSESSDEEIFVEPKGKDKDPDQNANLDYQESDSFDKFEENLNNGDKSILNSFGDISGIDLLLDQMSELDPSLPLKSPDSYNTANTENVAQFDGQDDFEIDLQNSNAILTRIMKKLGREKKEMFDCVLLDLPSEDLKRACDDSRENLRKSCISSLNELWSPRSEDISEPQSMFQSPPMPNSPSVSKPLNKSATIDTKSSSEDLLLEPNFIYPFQNESYLKSQPGILFRPETIALNCSKRPPTRKEFLLDEKYLPKIIYNEPFYGVLTDIPKQPTAFGGKIFNVPGNTPKYLPKYTYKIPFLHDNLKTDAICINSQNDINLTSELQGKKKLYLSSHKHPPRRKVFMSSVTTDKKHIDLSQIDAPSRDIIPTLEQTSTDNLENIQNLRLCSMELHVNTRKGFLPDPFIDRIECVYLCLTEDDPTLLPKCNGLRDDFYVHCIQIVDAFYDIKHQLPGLDYSFVGNEEELLDLVGKFVILHDPDILCGYEIHGSSWGYLIERASKGLKLDMIQTLSRITKSSNSFYDKERDTWGLKKTSGVHVGGRIVLNIWRLMRSEFSFTSFTYENVCNNVLKIRIPKFSHEQLTKWYKSQPRWRVTKYYCNKVQHDLMILDECNFIVKTSEFARVYGVEFFSVISRGSQFKVESMMLRIAQPENFLMISPSRAQVASMRAIECIPLVMEPHSGFYNSPLVVLDFQSLYPSIAIAYNYCYSTCLGKVYPSKLDTFGFRKYDTPPDSLSKYKDDLIISPNGVLFLKPHVREGVLRKMLSEILDTRIMVKTKMKKFKNHRKQHRIMDSRQLGLKLIANVTYGYTSAGFSGRMPCPEIADSIVQTGRETLENAIKTINNHPSWSATVVYGDTDSLFVYLPGSSKDRAFKIGNEIAKTITAMNPAPMKLKFEKVYHPCFLLTKKRYVGFKYESKDQIKPEFDAKGIETVRRDGCPAVSKILESSLKIFFKTQDLSQVKSYLRNQWEKILTGRVSIQDFLIAKEVKLGTYSDRGLPPPGAVISLEKMKHDPRAEPEYGERVPFIITNFGPNARLVDSAVSPLNFVNNIYSRLNSQYYITKQIIPVLSRIFDLVGADVRAWFAEMPKIDRILRLDLNSWEIEHDTFNPRTETLERFYQSKKCLRCINTTQGQSVLCDDCARCLPDSLLDIDQKLKSLEKRYISYLNICRKCIGSNTDPDIANLCLSTDCPVFYDRIKTKRNLNWMESMHKKVEALQW